MSRQSFLKRVKEAAARGAAHRVHCRELSPDAGYVGAGEDLCASLAAEVNEVGGHAHLAADEAAARDCLRRLLKESGARHALVWRHELLDRVGTKRLCKKSSIAVDDVDSLARLDEGERRAKMLAADVGITSCDLAAAETGTLFLCASPGRERVTSLLPPIHIAVVERDQIVPDLIDAFDRLAETFADGLPSNVSLITGPSKTGDIELQLTTGVHGPGEWHVVIIERPAEAASETPQASSRRLGGWLSFWSR